jgi:alanine racemase
MISLYDVLEACNGQLFGEPHSQLFTGLCFELADVTASCLFVAAQTGGGDVQATLREAVRRGAAGVLTVTPPNFNTDGLTVILVRDLQVALLEWTRLLLQHSSARWILVTGSGDTCVTGQALAHILGQQVSVCHVRADNTSGSLGPALTSIRPEHEVIVCEWQPGGTSQMLTLLTNAPFEAVVLCGDAVSPAVTALLTSLPQPTLLVADASATLPDALDSLSRTTVGIDVFGADWMAYNVLLGLDGTGFDLRIGQQRRVGRWLPVLGHAPLVALLRALAVVSHLGVMVDDGLTELKSLVPLPGHMRKLAGRGDSTLVDCTDVATLADALSALDWLAVMRQDGRRTVAILSTLETEPDEPVRTYRQMGLHSAPAVDLLLVDGASAAVAARAALDAGLSEKSIVTTHSPSELLMQIERQQALDANAIVLLLGGRAANLENVLLALLKSPEDADQLARPASLFALYDLASQTRPSRVEVDLEALAHNVRRLKEMVGPNVMLTSVVKADAYGNGAVAVARTALRNGAGHLAVAALQEALDLRAAGIDAPILVMSYTAPTAIRHAVRENITVTVYDIELARAYDLAASLVGGRLRVHVKVDTGMGRLGVMPRDAVPMMRQLLALRHLEVEGLYTHFAVADEDKVYTHVQGRLFRDIVTPLRAADLAPRYIHACNSAGTLAFPEYHFNMVRVGLAQHGLSPSDTVRVPDDFRPVMRWKTFVAQVKVLPDGHSVGYGRSYICDGDRRVAVLPIGYADGFRRGPSNSGFVLVRGQRAPILGRVSMEKTVVDVSHIPGVARGDEVVLVGAQGDARITADEVARAWGTISYEVLCNALARIPR